MTARTLRVAAMLAFASGVATAILVPEAPPSRWVTYGPPGIPSTTDHRLGLLLAIVGVALFASALLFAASRRAGESN